jgi:hypothetical protein
MRERRPLDEPEMVRRLRAAEAQGANKYGARRCPCEQGGAEHWHGSQAERARCFVLTQRERLGEIRNLHRHSRWPLEVNGQRVGVYTDDASYYLPDGTFVVEDVKSPATRRTEAYRLRRKMFAAQYGFEITEVE